MRYFTSLLILGLIVLFIYIPELDIIFSSLFYNSNEGFYLEHNGFVSIINNFVKVFFICISLGIAFYGIKKFLIVRSFNPKHYRKIIYVSLVIILGAGFIVHTILKDNIGRPRPFQITEFGGLYAYQAPFKISKLCQKNCSFVSGHASVGFIIYAIAFLYRGRQRYFYLSIATLLGLGFGFIRIVLGKHFLSDVIFAGIVMYLTAYLLALIIKPANENK